MGWPICMSLFLNDCMSSQLLRVSSLLDIHAANVIDCIYTHACMYARKSMQPHATISILTYPA